MPISKTKHINLLPQDDFQSTTFGRILKWALSSFRVMVIVTELIVMSAFLSRFWLDARNSDLNEALNVAKSQVLAYSDVENEFRLYQKKINIARSLYLDNKVSTIINEITGAMPEDVMFVSVQQSEASLQIKAIALSEQSVAQFLINLGGNKNLSNVTLSQVASSIDNSFATTFTLTADLKQNGGTK